MPENDLNNLDEQLRRKFENFGSHPSDRVWENIAAGVAQENRRKRRYWLWFSTVALLLMFSGTAAWLLLKDTPDNPITAVSSPTVIDKHSTEGSATTSISSGKNTQETTGFEKPDENAYAANTPDKKIENITQTNQPESSGSANTSDLSSAKTNSAKTQPGNKAEARKPVTNALASVKEVVADRSSVSNTNAISRSKAASSKETQIFNAKAKPATGLQGTKSGADHAALNEPSGAKPASVFAGTTSEEAVTARTAVKPVTGKESAAQVLTEKTAPENPILKDEIAVNIPDKAVVTQPQSELAIAVNEPATDAEKAGNTTPEKAARPETSESNTAETEIAETAANSATTNQSAGGFPIKDEVGSTSMAKSAAAAKTEEDYLEKEGGMWAQDTTGLTVAPPKDTTEIKEPHAIPVRAVEIFGSPEYGFRTLSETGLPYDPNYGKTRNQYESAGLGFSGGVHVTFGLTKKLGIKTGLQYTELREKLNYPDGFLPDKATHSSYKFITLPLYLVYEKRGYSNLSVEFAAGPNVNMYVGGQSVISGVDGYELKKWGDSGHIFKPYSLSATAGIGLNYRVSKVVSIMLRPNVTYFPWSVTDHDEPQQKPYSVGAQTGIRLGF